MRDLSEGRTNPHIAAKMRFTLHTMGNYLHHIYNLLEIDQEVVIGRVTAAKWYWSREDMIKHHYIVEADELPVIIEVRREPAGDFAGRGVV